MKKIVIAFLIAVTISGAQAQEDFHYRSAGPFLAFKTGVNGGYIPTGRKNSVAFNGMPDLGFTLFYPLGEESDLGLLVDLAYTTYAYGIKGVDVNYDEALKYNYITLGPSIHFNGFTAGLNFGIPVGNNFGDKLDVDKMNFMVEVRLGYYYPVLNDEDGTLNVFAQAGYMLTGIYKNFTKDDPLLKIVPPTYPERFTDKYNPRAVSLMIGLNYLLNF